MQMSKRESCLLRKNRDIKDNCYLAILMKRTADGEVRKTFDRAERVKNYEMYFVSVK